MVTIRDAFPGFSVDDIDAAREFYGTKLGLPVDDAGMGALRISLPSGQAVFVYPKPNHEPATFTILNFLVDNVDTAVDKLKSTGIKFEQYDLPDIKTDERGIARDTGGPAMAWFKDPAGNILSVLQRAD